MFKAAQNFVAIFLLAAEMFGIVVGGSRDSTGRRLSLSMFHSDSVRT